MRINKYVLILLLAWGFQSCIPAKRLYYFHDQLPGVDTIQPDSQKLTLTLKRGDRLGIYVSMMDPMQSTFFNGGVSGQSSTSQKVYIIREDGTIDFPMLGKVKLQGLPVRAAADTLTSKLRLYFNDPFVNVTFQGRVYVMNARIGSPIEILGERMTIFEALAQSSTLNSLDQKDQIWLVREENNERKYVKLDLSSKEIFKSPYYYLQSNDFVYVRPSKFSAAFSPGSVTGFAIGVAGVISTVILLINLFK